MPEGLKLGGLGGGGSDSPRSGGPGRDPLVDEMEQNEGDDERFARDGVQASMSEALGRDFGEDEAKAFIQAVRFATGKL